MIELYYWPTPNGHKITLFLEEAGLPYEIKPVNIGVGDQFKPDFLRFSPNNRMPAIIDTAPTDGGEPISVFESGAILIYLANKASQFFGHDQRSKVEVLQWLMWQMGGLGPMAGQNGHFNVYAPEKVPYAIARYVNETNRLYGVLDRQLEGRDWVAGGEYSIADMAIYPWIVPHEAHKQDLADFPNIARWFELIKARAATIRAYEKGAEVRASAPPITEEARKVLFGQTAASTAKG
jgi:GSH-dependent disulfide-bond oxidoreductase